MQLLRDGEDDVEVLDGEQILHPALEPLGLLEGLTLRAVAVPAGVVGDLPMPAAVAHLDVAAEGGGPAGDDRARRSGLIAAQPREPTAVLTEDVGELGPAASPARSGLRRTGQPSAARGSRGQAVESGFVQRYRITTARAG